MGECDYFENGGDVVVFFIDVECLCVVKFDFVVCV